MQKMIDQQQWGLGELSASYLERSDFVRGDRLLHLTLELLRLDLADLGVE